MLWPPNAANSHNVRIVNSSGDLSNTNAWNGNIGLRPLWWNFRTSKHYAESSKPLSKEATSRRQQKAANTRIPMPIEYKALEAIHGMDNLKI